MTDHAEPAANALHPEHQADLERSGLRAATIATAGIRSLAPGELPRYLNRPVAATVESAYLIPYLGTDFYRAKLFPPIANGDGHPRRYDQPAGARPRLYVPSGTAVVLADPGIPLRWTEGEKKALCADQAGLPCVGLGGLWNWLQDGEPIADLDRVDHVGRAERLIPDSDVWTRPDLLQAVYALGKALEARGATVEVVKLPAGPGGVKVGLDEFLTANGAETLAALPTYALAHAAFSRAAAWWKAWQKRKAAPAAATGDVLEVLQRGETIRSIHPAQDVMDGVLWYGVVTGGRLTLITSERQGYFPDGLPPGLALRHTDLAGSSVRREVALEWLSGHPTGSVAGAIDQLTGFFARYVVFRLADLPLLLAAWTLGTWCARAFRVYPYLSIRSSDKRCGKSRLLGLLARVTFNPSPPTAIPTEAVLFRGAARTGGVQLFDEVESLRGNKDRFDALLSVLNVGFEQGGVVSRLEKRGERFVDVAYEVYAPRALAGIAGLKETLEDRSLPVFLLRKRRDEPVTRVTAASEAEAQTLRDACALACLGHIRDVCFAYEQAPGALEREPLDDRAVDLWSPLVAVTLVADAEQEGTRTGRLLALARELAGLRDAEAEAGQTARLLRALDEIRAAEGEVLTPTRLLQALKTRPGWDWIKSPRGLAALLHPLGLFSAAARVDGRPARVYRLDLQELADRLARYGPPPMTGEPT
jgi:hypothetical protein